MKFEIGNTVKVIKNDGFGHEVGTIGIVKDLEKAPSKYVLVQDMNKTYNLWHTESELELYEEEFPERWCLEITKESFPFIQKTHSDFEDFKDYTQFSNRYLRSDHSYGHRSIKKPSEEYPEITLDQFKTHILKESTTM